MRSPNVAEEQKIVIQIRKLETGAGAEVAHAKGEARLPLHHIHVRPRRSAMEMTKVPGHYIDEVVPSHRRVHVLVHNCCKPTNRKIPGSDY